MFTCHLTRPAYSRPPDVSLPGLHKRKEVSEELGVVHVNETHAVPF